MEFYIIAEYAMSVSERVRNTSQWRLGINRDTEKSRSVKNAALSLSLTNRVLCSMLTVIYGTTITLI
jgi:hypothetical protein